MDPLLEFIFKVLLGLLIFLLLLLLWMLLSQIVRRLMGLDSAEEARDAMLARMDEEARENFLAAEQARKEELVEEIRELGDPVLLAHLLELAGKDHRDPQDLNDPDLVRQIAESLEEDDLRIIKVASDPATPDLDIDVESQHKRVPSQTPTDQVELVPIDSLEQLTDVVPEQQMLDDDQFYQQMAEGGLQRIQFFKEVIELVLMHVFLDGSGSMKETMRNGYPKHVWARGVVAKFLLKVMRGESIFYMRVFDGKPHELRQATTPEEARELLRILHKIGFTGGGTNIMGIIRRGVEDRRNGSGDITRAELVIITDGEDDDINAAEIKRLLGDDIRLHAILIGNDSAALKSVAATYVRL